MAEVIDLQQVDNLLKVHVVPVVSAVDLVGLQGLLKHLLQGQKDSNDQLQRHAADIDALKAAQAEVSQQAGAGTNADVTTAALEGLQGQLAALDKRLSDLEAQQQQPATEPSTGQHTMQDMSGVSTAADTTSTAPPAADLLSASVPTAPSDQQPTGLSELRQQQDQLAQQLANIAAAHKGMQQQLSALQDSKADRGGVRDMLAEGLAGKADAAAVNQLKAQLGDKADRSELDALLNAMAAGSSGPCMDDEPSSSGAGGDDPADDASTAAAGNGQQPESDHASSRNSSEQQPAGDGMAPRADAGAGAGGSRRSTREQGSAGDVAQQLSKLQLQLAVLQDRLNKKADSQAVTDLADGLASTNSQVADLSDALQALQQQAQATEGAPAALTSAADAWDPSTAQQLAARLAALEGALPGLQAAVAASQQGRRVSGEQPASSKLVQVLAAQLAELTGKVSRLSAQAADGTSGPSQPADPADDSSTPALAGAESGAGAGADVAAGGFSGGSAGGFGAELAAELDGRLSDLEALVQDLTVLKADQGGVQELRSLLADTATQADTDQLRQRLASQQSLLDRLARQISSLSSISHIPSAGAGSNSRPQSAASRSRGHSSTGAVTPASPEYSFFGGGAGAAGAAGSQDGMHAGAAAGLSTHHDDHMYAAGAGQQQEGSRWGAEFPGSDGVDVAGAGGVLDQEGGAVLGALQAQVQSQQASLEQLAEALCLLATGQAAPAGAAAAAGTFGAGAAATAAAAGRGGLGVLQMPADSDAVDFAAGRSHGAGDGSVPETPNLRFAGARSSASAAAAELGGAAGQGGASAAARPGTAMENNRGPIGSRLGAGGSSSSTGMGDAWGRAAGLQQLPAAAAMCGEPGPQVARLKRLLQTGQVGRKMDWFDPTLLQKMAQRLAAIDALLRNGAGAGVAAGAAASGDLEGKLRRLAADVRQLKDRMGEMLGVGAAGGQQGGLRALGQASDGDHSMLSGKPLGGYRCMACDRPLATLDSRPGPYLPSGQLPVSLASGAEVAAGGAAALGKLPPASIGSRRATGEVAYAAGQPSEPLVASSPDGRRLAGPQNWYKEGHGLPAEQLPKADVGPHLPPGGWRGAQSLRGEDGMLPLVRGGSTASTTGGTPRTAGPDRGVSNGGGR